MKQLNFDSFFFIFILKERLTRNSNFFYGSDGYELIQRHLPPNSLNQVVSFKCF